MGALYEIAGSIRQVIETGFVVDHDTGEILFDSGDLDSLDEAVRDKAEATALYIKELDALASAIKDEEVALHKRREAVERKAARLKDYLLRNLDVLGGSFETPRAQVKTRRSTVVVVDDERLVPDEYMNTKVTSTVDKRAVRLAIKAGTAVPGCAIENRESLVIK